VNPTNLYERAERIYEERFRVGLERSHLHAFVAIEPDSGEYFLGRTLSEAAAAARAKYPDRPCGILRVGHEATVHIGAAAT
jgi:hypothetical protein